ncbi:hypothetical protein CYLTODRAFT_490011 [Cylindrobasidium torrendii FP15055 ss-10]|uniref:BRCT domain-containing protein n=1 Tax=Cylindrobasidium torrendii FP15055 ss-10 TaxID=1314674 RepID=A0A0D7BCF2_9AGAR|nr:hypothetical protein CYLTODRAFT_490011 [Cylindrobasidium torrendii FP15055 ss-10]
MWTVIGPFDGDYEQFAFRKTKVLKTNYTYGVSRFAEGSELVINARAVSKKVTAQFIVGVVSEANVTDPTFRPSVHLKNTREKVLRITRKEENVVIAPQETIELVEGDRLNYAVGCGIVLKWEPCCVFVENPRTDKFDTAGLASLGVSLVHTPYEHITHHVTSELRLTPAVGTSLLSSAVFVKPAWVEELLRRAVLPRSEPNSLEFIYKLPLETGRVPEFAPTVPSALQHHALWKPTEERLNFFATFRFLCVGEKGRELESSVRTMLEHGGGHIETVDVQQGKEKWRKVLSRGSAKSETKMVGVANKEAISAVAGENVWREFVSLAKEFQVKFVDYTVLIKALVKKDSSSLLPVLGEDDEPEVTVIEAPKLTKRRRAPSAVPEVPEVPSDPPSKPDSPKPIEDVPMQAPEPPKPLRRGLVRRAPGAQATPSQPAEPSTSQSTPEPTASESVPLPSDPPKPPSRRTLIRRAPSREPEAAAPVTRRGLISRRAGQASTEGTPVPEETPTPAPEKKAVIPRSQLKRRRDQASEETSQKDKDAAEEEPQLKRIRAYFEETDPEKNGAVTYDGSTFKVTQVQVHGQSQTQSGSIPTGGPEPLLQVMEEEEETQPDPPSGMQSRKRKAVEVDVDVEMEMESPAKRRATDDNAVERASEPTVVPLKSGTAAPPKSVPIAPPKGGAAIKAGKSAKGAAPGKPDTDKAFLRALASTKRTTNKEDDFDREFNNLRISKPVEESPREQWKLLDDFGSQSDLRGNFMVVVEMDVPSRRARRVGDTSVDYAGQPNFKKFRRKGSKVTERSKTIQLFVSDAATLGEDISSEKSFPLSQVPDREPKAKAKVAPKTQGKRTKREESVITISDEDEDEASFRPRSQSKALGSQATQSSMDIPPAKSKGNKAKPAKRARALFIPDSDEEVEEVKADDDADDDGLTTQGTAPPVATQARKAPAKRGKPKLVVDDDSDDEAVFKPRATRSRR